MSFRNQNKPPTPCGPVNKNRAVDEAPLDKRKKIGTGRTMSSTTASRGRQALAPMITQKDAPVAPSETELTECENLEFTTDEIDVLLNEKFKGKKFDSKGKQDWLTEYIKKLKLCIKWFQKGLEDIVEEKENLHTMLDSSERKCVEAEAATKIKEEELNSTISELENNISSLKDSLANEESQKLDALDCLKIEREARLALEKDKISLKEELARAEQNVITANEKVKTQEDTYKRLKELNSNLHSHNIRLQKELEAKQKVETEKLTILENLTTLRGHKNFLEKELTFAKDSRDESVKQKETAMKEVDILRGELQQFREDRERQLSQIQELSSEVIRYKENTARTASEVNSLGMKTIEMEETCSTQREQISLLQHQLKVANQKLKMADLSSSEVRTEYEELKRRVKELEDELHEAEAQLLKGEELRKKLHNTILELKGNIRVFCRVRPMLSDDSPAADPIISYPTSVESAGRGIDIVPYGPKGSFTFDKVFSYDASQEDVFMEISQLVQSALDGYKVCIFAYGQTGSGKTYTMMGKQDNPKDMGLIPRSLEQIFKSSQAKAAQGWNYKMQVSMLEIYNDTIRDLLGARLSTGGSLAIRQDADGNTYVPELTIINVTNINEVSDLLQQAARSRTIGRTDMNEESSRSHFVFTLKIIGVKESSSEQVEGVLNLIDLAGSERIAKSGVTGDRMTETRAINKSLTALGNVFTALASHKNKKEKGHVPFRDSKLTYLLQPCLGGDSKTLMFVNISPDPLSVNESYNSLEFAKKVNGCEIGIPSRQTIRQINTQLGRG